MRIVMLSVKEMCEPSPDVLVPPGLYRGSEQGRTNAPQYKLRLSAILVEREVDVTMFVELGHHHRAALKSMILDANSYFGSAKSARYVQLYSANVRLPCLV